MAIKLAQNLYPIECYLLKPLLFTLFFKKLDPNCANVMHLGIRRALPHASLQFNAKSAWAWCIPGCGKFQASLWWYRFRGWDSVQSCCRRTERGLEIPSSILPWISKFKFWYVLGIGIASRFFLHYRVPEPIWILNEALLVHFRLALKNPNTFLEFHGCNPIPRVWFYLSFLQDVSGFLSLDNYNYIDLYFTAITATTYPRRWWTWNATTSATKYAMPAGYPKRTTWKHPPLWLVISGIPLNPFLRKASNQGQVIGTELTYIFSKPHTPRTSIR